MQFASIQQTTKWPSLNVIAKPIVDLLTGSPPQNLQLLLDKYHAVLVEAVHITLLRLI